MQISLLQRQSRGEKTGLKTPSSMFFPILRGRRNKGMDRIRKGKRKEGRKE
jgi:hypothetical protein